MEVNRLSTSILIFIIIFVATEILVVQGPQGPQPSGAAGSAGGLVSHGRGTSGGEIEIKPGDVYIDKYPVQYLHKKNETIEIILSIHAIDPRPGLTLTFGNGDIYIFEELLPRDRNTTQWEDYDLVGAVPNYESFRSGEIIWHFKDLKDLLKTKYIHYFIKTNISGSHVLGNTRLEAKDKIIFYESRPEFFVVNSPPTIENLHFPISPIWCGEKNFAEATIRDQDNDRVTCNLYCNGIVVDPSSIESLSNSSKYIWDLSNISAGNNIFKIKAADGNDTTESESITIQFRGKMFGILPYPEEYGVPILTGVMAGLILAGLRNIVKNKKVHSKVGRIRITMSGIIRSLLEGEK